MNTEHVQTKREIMELLSAVGVRPCKRLGQHFLIDGNLMRRLAASAELDPADLVLEVGAGTGGLTDLLVGRARKVACVEIDDNLLGILEDRFRDADNMLLIRGDILESKHRIMSEVASAIRSYDGGPTGSAKLVANLPYQAATPLIMNLLLDYSQVRRLCFTVQAEVGERITSGPNCKAYGPLSIFSQLICEIQTVARVPPEAFWPRPSVASVMLRMDAVRTSIADREELHRFTTLVRGAFEHRRKTLRSTLAYSVDEPTRDRVCRSFDASRRPESFSPSEWLEIHAAARG